MLQWKQQMRSSEYNNRIATDIFIILKDVIKDCGIHGIYVNSSIMDERVLKNQLKNKNLLQMVRANSSPLH